MENAMPDRCETCRFWQKHSLARAVVFGLCRIRSPQLALDISHHNSVTKWPMTRNDDWCGEFEAKEPARAEA